MRVKQVGLKLNLKWMVSVVKPAGEASIHRNRRWPDIPDL